MYKVNLWLGQFGRGNPGKLQLWGLSVADREDSPTELLKDCHGRAVEKSKRCKVHKAAKWHGFEKSSWCKYIPYLSHIYLLRANINHGHL